MHAPLKNSTMNLMASDTQPGKTVDSGSQVHLSLSFTDKDEAKKIWDRLAPGASITMPLDNTFFGYFGMLTDKFGIQWMVHFNTMPAK